MTGIIVVGAQWGDEGKGKIIDLLAHHASHVVRAQGGNNAGHTILSKGVELKLHLIPSGILYPHAHCYIAAGTVIDPAVLCGEIAQLKSQNVSCEKRLFISPLAHVIFPYHRQQDDLLEMRKGLEAVGTTRRGIGPCYADKIHRLGIRIGDLLDKERLHVMLKMRLNMHNEEIRQLYGGDELSLEELFEEYLRYGERLKPMVADVESKVYAALKSGQKVLFEGAQGTFLDVSFGTYPFVTSSSTIASGICAGAGIGPTSIKYVLGVAKAYITRVGQGPLPTALKAEEDFMDYSAAREYGTTTGRRRRAGWLDIVLLKEAVRLNGLTSLVLTKLDVLDALPAIKLCTGYKYKGQPLEEGADFLRYMDSVTPVYEELPGWQAGTSECKRYENLPSQARQYVERIEELIGIPIDLISVGPDRDQTIIRNRSGIFEE